MNKRNLTASLSVLFLVAQIAVLIRSYRLTADSDEIRSLRRLEIDTMENRIPVPVSSDMQTGKYPFFTVMKVFSPDGTPLPCVGTLIAPDVVLTSATKCLQASDITRVEVWVNTTSPSKYIENEHFRKAARWVVYPCEHKDDVQRPVVNEFLDPRRNSHRTCTSKGYDIALVFLDAPVVGVPLVLLNRDASFPGEKTYHRLTAIGIDESIDRDDYLDEISNDSRSMARSDHFAEASASSTPALACWKEHDSENFNEKSQLCARIEQKERKRYHRSHGYSCAGSGIPLLLQSSSAEKNVQVGITTMCSTPGMTTNVYTNVGFFAKWIDDQICLHSTSKPKTCQTGELKAAS